MKQNPRPPVHTKIRAPPFFLNGAGRAMATARKGGMLGQVDSLLRRLPVSERESSLQAGELRQAADDWRKSSERLLAKHRKTRGRAMRPIPASRDDVCTGLLRNRRLRRVTALPNFDGAVPPIGAVAVSRWSRTRPTHGGSIWRAGRLSPAAVQHLCCQFEVRPSSRPSVVDRLRVARNALPPPIAAIKMASWASGS